MLMSSLFTGVVWNCFFGNDQNGNGKVAVGFQDS